MNIITIVTLVKVAKSHHFLLSFVCLLYIVFVCLNCCLYFYFFLLPLVVNKDVHSKITYNATYNKRIHTWTVITVWTVVQTVFKATFNSYWDRQTSTPHKINTPEPIDKKIGTIDYIREGTSYSKFGRNPFTGGFWANGWNITKFFKFFYLYLFSLISLLPTGQTRGWIFTRDSSKDVKSRKDVPFWGYKT